MRRRTLLLTGVAGGLTAAGPRPASYETTARPSPVVRETRVGPGTDAVAPYTTMREARPRQSMRFAEYRNAGPRAAVHAPENRPQLTRPHTRKTYVGDWRPCA
ncbi:hypothetical protein A4E84_09520 [Streptomyces qaidamensis]|uniref:Uncharacterized protein n=1 Tax=Streptomyces qaidamensis TaxID=1783515 RepID=A0A143BWV2_9ACTN|nr:hypothetical protein A4E84_09520 [Streptomyces qaidamensis]